LNIQKNVNLARFTTFEIGGPARYFLHAKNDGDISQGLAFARDRGLRVFILGGGSNVLVSDKGFDGLVIQIGLMGLALHDDMATAAAGENWDVLVKYCVDNDLAGVECLSGIPGTVGGTPVQNVGAYGQEVSETIVSVRCLDRSTDRIVELSNEQCGFSYRRSIFNTSERGRYIVLSVDYRLQPFGRPQVTYKELIDAFAGREPSIKEVREVVLEIRRSKSMVIDVEDPNRRSAGSFFKNPVVSSQVFERIKSESGESVPNFPAGEGMKKVPAAWLIEHAGFRKGFALGNAGISTNHTLAIINRGSATAAEIVRLKNAVEKAVLDRFGVGLVPEPVFVGDV
jgi:UDP-N-acetylmuramate dehydrogenase